MLRHIRNWRQFGAGAVLFLFLILTAIGSVHASQSGEDPDPYIITGQLVDEQGQPVIGAEIIARVPEEGKDTAEPLAQTTSLENGSFALHLSQLPPETAVISIETHHFSNRQLTLAGFPRENLENQGFHNLKTLTLKRRVTAGFWLAGLIFFGVLLIIALEKLHSTTAALAGISAVFLVTFLGDAVWSDLYIFSLDRALTYINWEVIFLVMAMMIVIAIIEGTGVFQWTAFQAYRISRGRSWLLMLILMLITAVASALLDNFTTMLLMTPISLQIALALGINPFALIIPEVLASNVGGISTLIGTPTNILIGAHADIGFSGFIIHQTLGVVVALIIMSLYVLWHYRAEWHKQSGGISPRLYQQLEKNAQIEDPETLRRSGIVFGVILIGFIIGERYHIAPAVPALIGATSLLVWLKPDVQRLIKAVDWTTLVFFMALFMIVGAIQEVGLISVIAGGIGHIVGTNLILAIIVMAFGVGLLSVFIANIPLAASMLPVADFLTATIPGANNKVLYYALSMGAAMGGNGSIVGGEANLVTAGITEQAGRPIAFIEFLKVGLPVTLITLTVGVLWLIVHFAI
ncbi:MAG: ArsB/NhaD family transporter [Candidatus Promineifilaceae bacterium]